ncbi:MAG TPA: hypothetical protein VMH36_03990 [Alphaproteobacteria bacterium]|nr:hypothetical protein [Alphaproteobacteria bacterium]
MTKKRINYRFERAERERQQALRKAQRDARRDARRNGPADTGTATENGGPALAGTHGESEET